MLENTPLRRWDWWLAGLFVLHLAHALVRAHWFPNHLFDADLLAYFVYFRNWLTHNTSLFGVPYFTHPKPLLVFTLGPLANVSLAFYCSAIVSAILGCLLYLIGRDAFGRAAGILFSILFLADLSTWVLTLRSSADMYIAFFFFLTLYLCARERWVAASVALFLSALIKPVTLPCTLCFLIPHPRSKKAWLCALFPFLAIPLTLWANQVLLGNPLGSDSFFKEFAALRDSGPIATGDVVHFAFWTQLAKSRFVSTAPLGFLGVLVWLTRDRRRLTSPLLLMPLLFVIGYFVLSMASPYMPFFRFFWTVELWFLGFLTFGIVETARRLARGQRWVKFAVAGLLLFFLADDLIILQLRYRDLFAIPFEESMAFVSSTRETLANKPAAGERILAPLAFLPYLMWELNGRSSIVITAEQAAVQGYDGGPEWILDVPDIYANPRTRDFVAQLVKDGGYRIWLSDGKAALLALPPTSYP
ncbi:MAG: hypothetical protein ACHQ9S_07085 [Candidatus Binatia bacterium]